MKTKTIQVRQSQQGFSLLLAILVSGVALAIGLSLMSVTLRQLDLTADVRESEQAFQLASTGIECAEKLRRRYDAEVTAGSAWQTFLFRRVDDLSDGEVQLTDGIMPLKSTRVRRVFLRVLSLKYFLLTTVQRTATYGSLAKVGSCVISTARVGATMFVPLLPLVGTVLRALTSTPHNSFPSSVS